MVKFFWSIATITPSLLSVTVLSTMAAFADTQIAAQMDELTQVDPMVISLMEHQLEDDSHSSLNVDFPQAVALVQHTVVEPAVAGFPAGSSSESSVAGAEIAKPERVESQQILDKLAANRHSTILSPIAEENRAASPSLVQRTVQTFQQASFSSATNAAVPTANSVLDQVIHYSNSEQSNSNHSNATSQTDNLLLNQVSSYSNQDISSDPLAQITSITQLSDVQPTDWAYQALQSLVERYGCIVGYSDSTFRGQRALSRFEFAAGVNACLDRISELLAASTADLATKEDLVTIQRLQEGFAAELATLRGRVDVLEARTTELEANQFSTIAKLSGDAYFTVSDLLGEDVASENNTVFQYRSRLIFTTSFSGEDQLGAILQAGNVERFIQPGNEIRLAGEANTDGNIVLDTLNYVFPIGDRVLVALFGNAAGLDSLGFGVVTPFDIGAARGAVSRFCQRPPIYRVANVSTGAVANFLLTDELSFQLAYAGGEAGSPLPGNGLFGGNYGLLGQLKARDLFDILDLTLTYINSYTGISTTASGAINAGVQTGTGSIPAAVDVDRPVVANSYGVAANLKFDGFQIGGWAGFFAIRALELGDADVWNYGLTLAFPDLGGKGNLGGIIVGMQPRLTGTTSDLGEVLGRRRDPDTSLHVEAFYRIALNDNIDVTPAFVWLTAPNHDADNADILFSAVRTAFRF